MDLKRSASSQPATAELELRHMQEILCHPNSAGLQSKQKLVL